MAGSSSRTGANGLPVASRSPGERSLRSAREERASASRRGVRHPQFEPGGGPSTSRPAGERSLRRAREERASASRRASATRSSNQAAALRDAVRSFLTAGSSGTGKRGTRTSRPAPQGPLGGAAHSSRPAPQGPGRGALVPHGWLLGERCRGDYSFLTDAPCRRVRPPHGRRLDQAWPPSDACPSARAGPQRPRDQRRSERRQSITPSTNCSSANPGSLAAPLIWASATATA